ncbi:MAG: DUF1638 domain-containing protein [Actinomycetota bacterium]
MLACGALARELLAITSQPGLDHVHVECLPAELHNRPDRIPAAVEARLDAVAGSYDEIILGYADCGTGGLLDALCERRGIVRLPGAHCYELFAGRATFAALHEAELGTFYLTDYLARHFDRLIVQGLGLDRHPELADMYFGHYTRLIHLAQLDDPALAVKAEAAAKRLGLRFESMSTGYGELASSVVELAGAGAR